MIALISVNCVPIALAADDSVTTDLSVLWGVAGRSESFEVTLGSGFYGRNDSVDYWDLPSNYLNKNGYADIRQVQMLSDEWLSGAIGVYFSFYFTLDGLNGAYFTAPLGSLGYELYYINDLGQEGRGSCEFITFNPVNDAPAVSTGISIKATTIADSFAPVKELGFKQTSNNMVAYWGDSTRINLYVPSVSVIAAPSSGDLAALEGIADGIAAQSQIMSAMYGDIMSVLNNMYSRLGNIQAVEETANGYFQTMISLLESLNTSNTNIYSLLQAQFAVLKAVIETESGDIQAAIEKQTDDLKAYFDDVLGGAVGTLPDDSASADDIINESHDDEQQYHSDALNRFNELSASFNGFTGDVGSGIALAGTLFSRVWGALGNYVILYTFPLLLGLALVIIGRLGRGMVKKSSQDRNADE